MRTALLLPPLVCLLLSCHASAQVTPGRTQKRFYDFKAADKQMEYTLYVPNSYSPQKASPLIVALHGLGSSPLEIMRYPGLTRHAERYGYIVVAPMGYNSRGWYGSRGTGGGRRSDPKNLGELSEQDVMNVLGIIRQELNIDSRRIYLMGHSMGGGGTWHLAMKYPDIWAALAPLAPAGPRSRRDLVKARRIPVIVVQGDRDSLVYATRRWVERMKELKMEHRYIEVAGGDHVRPAFQHFPEIFDFFNTHTRPPTQEGVKSPLPSSAAGADETLPSLQKKVFQGEVTVPVRVPYLLHLPKAYRRDGPAWPLLLFLHGAGSSGTNLDRVKRNGIPSMLPTPVQSPLDQFIVLAPQSRRRGWDPVKLDALLTDAVRKYHVDEDRIYLTGISMGGYGTWALAAAYPERFAAIVPICGGGRPATADALKNLPIWVFHGAKDDVVPVARSTAMVRAIEQLGGKVRFTIYPNTGHDAWTEAYNDPQLYAWLLQHKRLRQSGTPSPAEPDCQAQHDLHRASCSPD